MGVLPATSVGNSEIVGRNDEKSAKSDFIKPVHGVEKPSFLTFNARRAFTQLGQAFIEALIIRHFDP